MNYATFGQRLAATLVDFLWLVPMAIALTFTLYGADAFGGEMRIRLGAEIVSWLVPAVIVISFWMSRQATPGKVALKIMIVDAETGGMPSLGQLVTRYVGYIISSFVFCLGYLWMLWDNRNQTWHDKLARTVVIKRD